MTPLERLKLLIFDWDGTLLDSMKVRSLIFARAIVSHFVFPHQYIQTLQGIYRETSGMPITAQLSEVGKRLNIKLSSTDVQIILKNIRQNFDIEYSKGLPLMLGVREILPELKENYILTISSSSRQHLVRRYLTKIGFRQYFQLVPGKKGVEHFHKIANKWGVKKTEIGFIGDSLYDMRLAKQAGLVAIGLIGTFSKSKLQDSGADVVANNWYSLQKLLAKSDQS